MAADLLQLHSPSLHSPTIRTIASPYRPLPSNHLTNRPFHFPTCTPQQIPSLHHHSHKTPQPTAENHSRPLQLLIPTAHLSSRITIIGEYGPRSSQLVHSASEKTKVRSVLSGALVSTLMALAKTNLNIIANEVPVYSVVLEYLLPIAIHLLLFRADLRRILQSIGVLLLVFLLGSDLSSVRRTDPMIATSEQLDLRWMDGMEVGSSWLGEAFLVLLLQLPL
ncbi:uncharacterized protein LOC131255805 isoform X2 [Magnolia sinica]|uniref:uncharacterized protein LOC131255793 isoform X1 n=1 Tax=Magnolia sinica TaxID=86752 RepID=UPI00265AA778|nr:uncharacterized protein LOC131255793 isoform X1 [Magnolia sinica]XP_058112594.1 uncharacterized protein LOC131255793 isoform X1 [Magnolia sinica]XP_058112595.1 uncharacterized protein LOC131255793 isoform X1 [Magnolia sinica]XP_058112596.1 uncharacterized protein LOC131255793 isoform X1 [Magnolia sinica]XP_058112597.1 uncharacterized protein LOC131255793 isoform X1 [Magnolia sinica]XP_058112641.1 uncharacterized protein LOC131255805 isoform X2 [Magnolia sinica]XP_058112643.1 uncharacterize